MDASQAGIGDTVTELRRLGVALKIITGDNALVAATLSRQVGLVKPTILTGPELRRMSDEALFQRVNAVDVFAEVEPNQKERIILALKKAGNVVGYMGDGINDVSALHVADVGISVNSAVDAAKELEAKYGLSAEIVDARSLVPFNYDLVLESVSKTGRVLLVSDACERNSILHTMASKIAHLAFDVLDAPPVVVGARNWITPPDELEESFFPFPVDILDAIHEHILPLDGYTVSRVCDVEELKRRSRLGI